MTTDEALKNVQDYVQECRESGYVDLRSILSHIKYLREDLSKSATSTKHGVNCPKVPHAVSGYGYLHADRDDGPYDVDGVLYCGRCHQVL